MVSLMENQICITFLMFVIHYLPIRLVLAITAGHRTHVWFFGWQVGCYPFFEMHPCKVVLKVPVEVFGGGRELTDGADLDRIFSGVTWNT